MLVRKTILSGNSEFSQRYSINGYSSKKPKKRGNFQQQLLFALENSQEFSSQQKQEYFYSKENLENEIKKIFLGEILKKDHLFSGSLSETQKENIIKISELYY